MGFKANIAFAILDMRIVTLLVLVASAVLLVTDNYKGGDDDKTSFKDIFAYRYVLAMAAVGGAYLILQLPFTIYHAWTEKRLIRGKLLPLFDFYTDKVVSLLLASGVGAGFAVSFELKKILPDVVDALIAFAQASGNSDFEDTIKSLEQEKSKTPGFFDRGIIASSVLLGGCVLRTFFPQPIQITNNTCHKLVPLMLS